MIVSRLGLGGLALFVFGAVMALGAAPVEAVAAPAGAGIGLLLCAAHEAIMERAQNVRNS